MSERTRILELRARNVKSVREVEIDLRGEISEIRGDAGQGKTSILQAIEGALRGLDPELVRQGAGSAEIELRLDVATINRIIPSDPAQKATLMVTAPDGSPMARAQDFLRTICGPAAFRPVEWVQLGGGEAKGRTERLRRQRDELLAAITTPLDVEDVDEAVAELGAESVAALDTVNLGDIDFCQHAFVVCAALEKACYAHRTLVNARKEDAEHRLALVPAPETRAPAQDLAACEAAYEAALTAYHGARNMAQGREAMTARRADLRKRIAAEAAALPERAKLAATEATYTKHRDAAEARVAELTALLAAAKRDRDEAAGKLEQCAALARRWEAQDARARDLSSIEAELSVDGALVDVEALRDAMGLAKAAVEARKAQDAHDAASATAVAAARESAVFDGLVQLFRDTLPQRVVASSNLPLEGLSLDDGRVLIDGLPLHQLGTSEQMRVGVMIAAALNPRSGFVLIDGAESLGRADRAALAASARELGLQLIMTFVDDGAVPGPGVVVMEEGCRL